MEEGSLLSEALKQEKGLENSLLVDVYCLPPHSSEPCNCNSIDHLLALAATCVELNEFLQLCSYPWLSGGDGPVFGIHVSEEGIPHLRAICRYGHSVADEWMLIGLMLQYTKEHSSAAAADHYHLAIECWDVDDGQVLLIQSAQELPDWVDRIGPAACRHRCWIADGCVQLVAPMRVDPTGDSSSYALSLAEALQLIQNKSLLVSALVAVNRVIRETVNRVNQTQYKHRAALAVPRSVATLIQRRPDIVSAACQAFVDHAGRFHLPKDYTPLAGTCEDWVWTSHAFGRTAYAMLRTVSAAPHWKTDNAVPAVYNSIEVKRLKRTCAVQATPHLRHALQMGVRLVAGLDCLLLQQQQQQSIPPQPTLSVSEQRVLHYWSRIDQQCQRDGNWLAAAWQMGPNKAAHNLEFVLKCPVFEEEVKYCQTPLSHPQEDLWSQIRKELLRKNDAAEGSDFVVPRPEDVDDEEWMTMPSDEELRKAAAPVPNKPEQSHNDLSTEKEEKVLDEMLGGVQSFVANKSSYEGVAHHDTSHRRPIEINPTVFLNLLHTVLRAESADDLSFPPMSTQAQDPFFSEEDYELMQPDEDETMIELMQAMDAELKGKASASRNAAEQDMAQAKDNNVSDEVAQDVLVLSNLLKSIDAGAGAPGPVPNILKEMGMEPPDLASEEQQEDEDPS